MSDPIPAIFDNIDHELFKRLVGDDDWCVLRKGASGSIVLYNNTTVRTIEDLTATLVSYVTNIPKPKSKKFYKTAYTVGGDEKSICTAGDTVSVGKDGGIQSVVRSLRNYINLNPMTKYVLICRLGVLVVNIRQLSDRVTYKPQPITHTTIIQTINSECGPRSEVLELLAVHLNQCDVIRALKHELRLLKSPRDVPKAILTALNHPDKLKLKINPRSCELHLHLTTGDVIHIQPTDKSMDVVSTFLNTHHSKPVIGLRDVDNNHLCRPDSAGASTVDELLYDFSTDVLVGVIDGSEKGTFKVVTKGDLDSFPEASEARVAIANIWNGSCDARITKSGVCGKLQGIQFIASEGTITYVYGGAELTLSLVNFDKGYHGEFDRITRVVVKRYLVPHYAVAIDDGTIVDNKADAFRAGCGVIESTYINLKTNNIELVNIAGEAYTLQPTTELEAEARRIMKEEEDKRDKKNAEAVEKVTRRPVENVLKPARPTPAWLKPFDSTTRNHTRCRMSDVLDGEGLRRLVYRLAGVLPERDRAYVSVRLERVSDSTARLMVMLDGDSEFVEVGRDTAIGLLSAMLGVHHPSISIINPVIGGTLFTSNNTLHIYDLPNAYDFLEGLPWSSVTITNASICCVGFETNPQLNEFIAEWVDAYAGCFDQFSSACYQGWLLAKKQ